MPVGFFCSLTIDNILNIIVLIILAGISISMLSGENGILNIIQDAKGTNEYASAVEQVKLTYMAIESEIMTRKIANSSYNAQDEGLKFATKVEFELKEKEWTTTYDTTNNVIEIIYTAPSLKAGMAGEWRPAQSGKIEFEIGLLPQDSTLTIDGMLINGTGFVIKDKDGKPISLSKIADYYGHDVLYNGKTYQLFYVDRTGKYSNGEPRIWIQYKSYISGVKLSDHYETTGISTEDSILWQVNPDLDSSYGNTIRTRNSWNGNIQGMAYLCNVTNWNYEYVGTDGIAAGAYAIGGVSAEMYCDSYNQFRKKTTADADYLATKAYGEGGYGFKPCNTTPNSEGYGAYTGNLTYPIGTANVAYVMYGINRCSNMACISISCFCTHVCCG